jgi:hypothetical protein
MVPGLGEPLGTAHDRTVASESFSPFFTAEVRVFWWTCVAR